MKTVKIILSLISGFLILVLGVAAVIPSDYSLKREVEINRASNEVFDYIRHLKNMDNYSTWAMLDPNMKKSYEGQDGTVGFISRWESDHEKVGKGEQEIVKLMKESV